MSYSSGSYKNYSQPGSSNQNDNKNFNYNTPKQGFGRGRDRGGKGKGRGSRPPGLTGREIGMFYKNRSIQKNKKQDELINKRKILEINSALEQKIQSMLENAHLPSVRDVVKSDSDYSQDNFEASYDHIGDSQFKKDFLKIISGNIQDNLSKVMMMESKLVKNEGIDKSLMTKLTAMHLNDKYSKMLEFRKKLPAFQMKQQILDLIDQNQVILISGETGCGKTTQVAQFILDNEIEKGNGSITSIACTQPRRISAISVAERVAAERGESLGQSVGFKIRLERVVPREHGNILFCTTGMLLQFMQSDPALRNYSHIILDEIHERSTESDFIIALLKQVIPKRPDLKVILMSATLNSEQFSKYYDNCPSIHIPGFTYPVQEFYLEDVLKITRFQFPVEHIPDHKKYSNNERYRKEREEKKEFKDFIRPYIRQLKHKNQYPEYVLDELANPKSEDISLELIERLTHHICLNEGPGAILIFLPGMTHISKLHKMMTNNIRFSRDKFVIYPLHSRMPTVDQKQIFKPPPDGVRKIIIATTIAETSITIEDVVYVIDCGKSKLTKFDLIGNIETLQPEWISLANAKQRKGRAGRVQPGICYHLYTKVRESQFDKFPVPEILCTRLEEVILQLKILQLGKAETFLSTILDPPDSKTIKLSTDLLRKLNALDDAERLTPLGYHLAQLPLDPRTGKMIIWASLFSCVDPVFGIAASLSFKDAFYSPIGKEAQADAMKQKLSMGENSDHIALAKALDIFEERQKQGWNSVNNFCFEYFLSKYTLNQLSEMKKQFASYLYEMKFLNSPNPKDPASNRNSTNAAVIKAIVCAGLYPNVAILSKIRKHGVKLKTPEDGNVEIHPSSVNVKNVNLPYPFLTYFLKRRTTNIFLYDTTCVSPHALLMANPESLECVLENNCSKIIISEGIHIYCQPRLVDIVKKLQIKLNDILEYKITHPGAIRWEHAEGQILKSFIALISQEGNEFDYNADFCDE